MTQSSDDTDSQIDAHALQQRLLAACAHGAEVQEQSAVLLESLRSIHDQLEISIAEARGHRRRRAARSPRP